MNLDTLRLMRNVLFRLAAISFAFAMLMAMLTIGLWDTWAGVTSQWYRTTPAQLGPIVVNFFAMVKFYYIFVVLAPALALHWTIKAAEGKQ